MEVVSTSTLIDTLYKQQNNEEQGMQLLVPGLWGRGGHIEVTPFPHHFLIVTVHQFHQTFVSNMLCKISCLGASFLKTD